jgi:hypothetical protein
MKSSRYCQEAIEKLEPRLHRQLYMLPFYGARRWMKQHVTGSAGKPGVEDGFWHTRLIQPLIPGQLARLGHPLGRFSAERGRKRVAAR